VVAVAPFAGWAWQQHADSVKARNPFAWYISSGRLLSDWVGPGGVPALDPAALEALAKKGVPAAVGHFVVVAAAAAGVLLARRRRLQFALALGGFLAHFAVFARLDGEFEYYWYGAGVYLVAAVGLAVVALLECEDWRRLVAWGLLALACGAAIHRHTATTLPLQRLDAYRKPDWVIRLARAVGEATGPQDVIVVFGMDWNPELPYYAKRRALMWPGWADPRPGSDDFGRALVSLEGQRIGALVSCRDTASAETVAKLGELWNLSESPTYRARCRLLVRQRPARAFAGHAHP
jgi:hypothetical protein